MEPQREYPYGELVAHVLGFTGAVTPDELARLGSLGYLHDDTIGKQGVEATFEEVLRGEWPGEWRSALGAQWGRSSSQGTSLLGDRRSRVARGSP